MNKFLPIVASVIVIAFFIYKQSGKGAETRFSSAKLNQKIFAQALQGYFKDTGGYPSNEEGLGILMSSSGNKRPYLRGIPRDPWGNSFVYMSFGEACTVISYGADGVAGGDGENEDISTYVSARS